MDVWADQDLASNLWVTGRVCRCLPCPCTYPGPGLGSPVTPTPSCLPFLFQRTLWDGRWETHRAVGGRELRFTLE